MITPKYKVSIENHLKQETDSTFTNSPEMASMIVTGIIGSGSFADIIRQGGRIVVTGTEEAEPIPDPDIPFVDDYANDMDKSHVYPNVRG